MVSVALDRMPPGILFDAVCETSNCLPDAVQILTPCTLGNGWLKVIHLGRYAVTLYDKTTGAGTRVYVDSKKIEEHPEIASWFYKRKPKKEQDSQLLCEHIRDFGESVLGVAAVSVRPRFMQKIRLGETVPCPLCGESHPRKHGAVCRGCQGDAPYFGPTDRVPPGPEGSALTRVPLGEAEGRTVLHDMTQIIPGESKGAVFEKGHVITAGDMCRLQQMGRRHVHVVEGDGPGAEWVHEDEAAAAFASRMAGPGVAPSLPPREGKINLAAQQDGLLLVDKDRLFAFNLIPGVMCAGRQGYSMVVKDRAVAGTRAIPLYLPRRDFEAALRILEGGPLFEVRALKKARVGVLVTGTEVFQGLVKDRFIPVITSKAEALGSGVVKSVIAPDGREEIRRGVLELLAAGAEILVTTAGLSVDPDDTTRQGLADAGATDLLYGAPVLPGAMSLLARIGEVPVLGVPACALYFKTTAFDLFFPRVLAGVPVTRRDLAQMGHGAFCLDCKVCTYPKCPFGK
jgi:formylmethanofuran dehydrogenase subunit E